MPVPDIDVKNFSLNEIKETKVGFMFSVDWGGGNYFYGRKFSFVFRANEFFFDNIEANRYVQEASSEIKTTRKIEPNISMRRFMVTDYIKNE
jgi:hypothetical protein